MRFTKMQGLGNDYVYVDGTKEDMAADLPGLARRVSDRRFGIGADGLIWVGPSALADIRMRIFNADGSEGEMCGNGLRCAGAFARARGLVPRDRMTVETLAGLRSLVLHRAGGVVVSATADMGVPRWGPERTLRGPDGPLTVRPVSVGNPHAVLWCADPAAVDVAHLGPAVERHPSFPRRTNVEFAAVLSPRRLRLRVWERGSGETPACGTGACAALTAAVLAGRAARDTVVEAELPGGTLALRWARDGHLSLTGPVVTVFEGEFPTEA